MVKIIETIKSQGFGATIGSGTFGFIKIFFPNTVSNEIGIVWVMGVGAILGIGLKQAYDERSKSRLTKDNLEFVRLQAQLYHLELLRSSSQIPDEFFLTVSFKIIEQHFKTKVLEGQNSHSESP